MISDQEGAECRALDRHLLQRGLNWLKIFTLSTAAVAKRTRKEFANLVQNPKTRLV